MTIPRRHDVVTAIGNALAARGFRKFGPGAIFAIDLAEGVRGWVSLPTFPTGGVVEISPKVGVRHEGIHSLMDQLTGRKPGHEPTVSIVLGYLMPQRTSLVAWRFDDERQTEAQAINAVEAIAEFGLPYMRANSTLPLLMETIKASGLRMEARERLPAALGLLGRWDDGLAMIRLDLQAIGTSDDEAATEFRAFARAYETEATKHAAGSGGGS